MPALAVSVMRGKNAARAAPMFALAAISACSAWRTSGRRSSTSDGRPTGSSGRPGGCLELHASERRRLLLGDVEPVVDALCECYGSQERDIEFFVAHHLDQPRRRVFGESAVIVGRAEGSFEAARMVVDRLCEGGAVVTSMVAM